MHHDVAVGDHFDGLEGTTIGSDEALPPLGEALFVANHVFNLDDITLDIILHDLQRLLDWDTTGEKLDEVPVEGIPGKRQSRK